MRKNIFPSLECLTNWRNAGSLSWPDIGKLATMLKGDIGGVDVRSSKRGN